MYEIIGWVDNPCRGIYHAHAADVSDGTGIGRLCRD